MSFLTGNGFKLVFSDKMNASSFCFNFQNSLPKRMKGINMYNEPPFFDLIFSVLSSFMKDKTKSRVGEGFFLSCFNY